MPDLRRASGGAGMIHQQRPFRGHHFRGMIRRTVGTLAGFAIGFALVAGYMAVAAEPEPELKYEPPLSEQCQAVMADPEGLAEWLADRNGITPAKARQTVADAITNVCAK